MENDRENPKKELPHYTLYGIRNERDTEQVIRILDKAGIDYAFVNQEASCEPLPQLDLDNGYYIWIGLSQIACFVARYRHRHEQLEKIAS